MFTFIEYRMLNGVRMSTLLLASFVFGYTELLLETIVVTIEDTF